MPVLSQPKNKSTAIDGNIPLSLNWADGDRSRRETAVAVVPNRCTLPRIRIRKVLAIRRQLADDSYDLDKRLNAILDQLLKTVSI